MGKVNKQCPNCDLKMFELNDQIDHKWQLIRNLYPKESLDLYRGRRHYEYRFFCKECKNEWIYFSHPNQRFMERIPELPGLAMCAAEP